MVFLLVTAVEVKEIMIKKGILIIMIIVVPGNNGVVSMFSIILIHNINPM